MAADCEAASRGEAVREGGDGVGEVAPDTKADVPQGGEDVRGQELMPYDDGSLSADKAQSSAMGLVLNYTEPAFAAGAAVFGLGLVVLPFLARIGQKKEDASGIQGSFSYDALGGKSSKHPFRVFQESELRKRLGPMDGCDLVRELTMSTDELDDHMNASDMGATDSEISKLQKWREKANTHLKSLQKRSALAFLGLPPEATEADIGKMYKKMALELHPDKGGDPEKFQELQEMKERLNEGDDEKKDEDEEDEEVKKAKEKEKEEDAEGNKLAPSERLKKQRMEAHDSAIRVWERAKKAKEEIVGDKAIKSNSQPALNMLRNFVDRFVTSEVKPLRHGDTRGAEVKFKKFIHQGAEIIAVAAIHDVQTTLSTIAMTFNYRIAARSGSAEIKAKCDSLLEAIADVPSRAEDFLKQLEDALSDAQEREKREKEERAAKQKSREAQGDYSGDQGLPNGSAAKAASSTAHPASTASPSDGGASHVANGRSQAAGTDAAAKKPSDPFGDFDFDPEPRARAPDQRPAPKQPPSAALAKPAVTTVTAAAPKRTGWDLNFDHPYAGALKSNGTGIFCRPCQRWINTYEYNVEVFFSHIERAHPNPPPGWKGR